MLAFIWVLILSYNLIIGKQNKCWSEEYLLYLGEGRESLVEEAFAWRWKDTPLCQSRLGQMGGWRRGYWYTSCICCSISSNCLIWQSWHTSCILLNYHFFFWSGSGPSDLDLGGMDFSVSIYQLMGFHFLNYFRAYIFIVLTLFGLCRNLVVWEVMMQWVTLMIVTKVRRQISLILSGKLSKDQYCSKRRSRIHNTTFMLYICAGYLH